MKHGRKPGKAKQPSHGSLNAKLNALAIGAYLYLECPLDKSTTLQRRIHQPAARRPLCMADKRFTTEKYTAVSASRVGRIKYLICIKRVA